MVRWRYGSACRYSNTFRTWPTRQSHIRCTFKNPSNRLLNSNIDTFSILLGYCGRFKWTWLIYRQSRRMIGVGVICSKGILSEWPAKRLSIDEFHNTLTLRHSALLTSIIFRGLELSAFFLQFIQWWQNEASQGNLTNLPVPEPPSRESSKYNGKCPICLQVWQIPTAVSVSGWVHVLFDRKFSTAQGKRSEWTDSTF